MRVWRLLTLLCGALPATWLGAYAAVLAGEALRQLADGIVALNFTQAGWGLFCLSWSGLGLYGTISLWAVGIGFHHRFWLIGLASGGLAALPFVLIFVLTGYTGLFEFLVLAPTVVASLWLYASRSRRDRLEPDDEFRRDLAELRLRGSRW